MKVDDIYRNLPNLETPRLVLRRIKESDAGDMFDYASDPNVSRYVGWPEHRTIQDSREFIQFVQNLYKSAQVAPWGIERKEDGKFIGTIGYLYWFPDHHRAELGYAIGREFWGMGLMTEAAERTLEFGFLKMRLHRIEARCEPPNTASARVLEKIGMKREGLLRDHMFAKGSFRDLYIYSILRPEWEERRKV